MESGQNNKPSKSLNSDEGEDKISNLPDFILALILSFLPTKFAVRTSVLSKRWLYLWTFITDLSFNDNDRYRKRKRGIKKQRLVDFVYRVLLHLNNSSIQSFCVDFSDKYDPFPVMDWISVVLNRRVKRLHVDSRELAFPFCYSFLKFQSLDELVLKVNSCAFRVPNSICFSSLTVLELKRITFTPESSDQVKKLTLQFRVLRRFETRYCTWLNVKSVTLDVPLLEVIIIEDFRKVLRSDESHTVIKFCASRLREFSYHGYILPDISLFISATNVASVKITVSKPKELSQKEAAILVSKFLKQFSKNVECLKLNWFRVKECLLLKDSLMDLPEFEMLSRLKLDQSIAAETLLVLLLKTPLLNTLIFKEPLHFGKKQFDSAIVPTCFQSNLQVIKFEWFCGSDDGLRFAIFLMENVQVLKRLSFSPVHETRRDREAFDNVKEKLLAFYSPIIEFPDF